MEGGEKTYSEKEIAVFGGGCFWCTEAVFRMLRGVASVVSGFAGGSSQNPSYESVTTGRTGHVEVVRVEYDPAQISFDDLLAVFFATHDPFSRNRQGYDVGTEYRSIILYTTPEQRKAAERAIKELGTGVATELKLLDTFYPAETYHQDFYIKNPDSPYCRAVINPKLEKVKQKFRAILKEYGKDTTN